MIDFFEKSTADPKTWEALSDGSLDRIFSRYTWEIYAKRMLSLTNIYRCGAACRRQPILPNWVTVNMQQINKSYQRACLPFPDEFPSLR